MHITERQYLLLVYGWFSLQKVLDLYFQTFKSGGDANIIANTENIVDLKLGKINLEMFSVDAYKVKSLSQVSLTYLEISEISFSYVQIQDKSKFNFLVSDLAIKDTRPSVNNNFKDVFRASTKNPLISAVLEYENVKGRCHFISDSFALIITLDHLFLLSEYISKPFASAEYLQITDISKTSIDSSGSAVDNVFDFDVNITNVELIIVENPLLESSEAIVIQLQMLQISKTPVLIVTSKGIATFLCQMDCRQESAVKFLHDFDCYCRIDELIFRVSYEDIIILRSIISRMNELYEKLPKVEQKTSKVANVGDAFKHLQTFTIKSGGLRLIVIDDLGNIHLPVIDLNFKGFGFTYSNNASNKVNIFIYQS